MNFSFLPLGEGPGMRVRSLGRILFDFPLCLPMTTFSKRVTRQALPPTLSQSERGLRMQDSKEEAVNRLLEI